MIFKVNSFRLPLEWVVLSHLQSQITFFQTFWRQEHYALFPCTVGMPNVALIIPDTPNTLSNTLILPSPNSFCCLYVEMSCLSLIYLPTWRVITLFSAGNECMKYCIPLLFLYRCNISGMLPTRVWMLGITHIMYSQIKLSLRPKKLVWI